MAVVVKKAFVVKTLIACGLGSAFLATEFCANEPWCSFPSVIIESAKDLMALGQGSQRCFGSSTRTYGETSVVKCSKPDRANSVDRAESPSVCVCV